MIRPLLFPRWLATLDAQGQLALWRLHMGWDGKLSLAPQAAPPAPRKNGKPQPCLLLVSPRLPFRRRLHRYPEQETARAAMLRSAPDEFPLAAAEHCYAMAPNVEQAGEGYLYALPRAALASVGEAGLRPVAIRLVDEGLLADPVALAPALPRLARQAAAGDFLRQHQLIPPAVPLYGGLAAGLAILMGLLTLVLLPQGPVESLERQQIARLRQQAGPALAQYQALKRMESQQQALAAFQKRPEARLAPRLKELLANLPEGYSIRAIQLDGQSLLISGRGLNDPEGNKFREWAARNQLPAESATFEEGGGLILFKVQQSL